MPELPEVEAARRLLERELVGRRISSVRVHDHRAFHGASIGEFHHALKGAEVLGAGRRGKYLLLPLLSSDGQCWVVVHFGMTGWLQHSAAHPVMSLEFDDAPPLLLEDPRRFAKVWLHDGRISEFAGIAKLGPEADQLTEEQLAAALDSARDVKSLLMDQGRIAGLGNIYANEALWRAKVNPFCTGRRAKKSDAGALHSSIVEVVRSAVEFSTRALTLDYRPVETDEDFGRTLNVYGRGGEPCRVHATTKIRRVEQGGRSSFYCPRCQPARRRSRASST